LVTGFCWEKEFSGPTPAVANADRMDEARPPPPPIFYHYALMDSAPADEVVGVQDHVPDPVAVPAAAVDDGVGGLVGQGGREQLVDLRNLLAGYQDAIPVGSRACIVHLTPRAAAELGEKSVTGFGPPPTMAIASRRFFDLKKAMSHDFGLLEDRSHPARRYSLRPGNTVFDLCLMAQDFVTEMWPSLSVSSRVKARKLAGVLSRYELRVGAETGSKLWNAMARAALRRCAVPPGSLPPPIINGEVVIPVCTIEQLLLEPSLLDMRAEHQGAAAWSALMESPQPGVPPSVNPEALAGAADVPLFL
jgi:hypothetical protein